MRLRDWALIAEIFSAFAVFATLILLLMEVRAGNELTRIASFQDILTRLNEQRTLAISEPRIGDLVFASSEGNYPDWGTPEAYWLRMYVTNDFNTFNIAYFSYQAGVISDVEWERLSRPVCRIARSMPAEYLEEIYFRLTDNVVTYLESNC